LINYKITYGADMNKTPLPRCLSLQRSGGAMPPLSGVPAYRCQQSFSRCITWQDICVQQ